MQRVTVESHWILRSVVPGQVSWDHARTAAANGDYGYAILHTIAMGSEIVITVVTLGQGSAVQNTTRATVTTVEGAGARVGGAAVAESAPLRNQVLQQQMAGEGRLVPELGRKLEYILGKATGAKHNVDQSIKMLKQLESVGLRDTPATRQLLTRHLDDVLNNASNIVRTESTGRVVRESLLMGPNGMVKLESIWEGTKLITMNVFGGKL